MRRAALGCFLLAIGAIWTGGDNSKPSPHKPITLRVLGEERNGEIWGQTYFPPLLSFKVLQGKAAPTPATLCEVVVEKHKYQVEDGRQLTNSVITLHCEEGLVMELDGIDLEGGRQ